MGHSFFCQVTSILGISFIWEMGTKWYTEIWERLWNYWRREILHYLKRWCVVHFKTMKACKAASSPCLICSVNIWWTLFITSLYTYIQIIRNIFLKIRSYLYFASLIKSSLLPMEWKKIGIEFKLQELINFILWNWLTSY